MHTVEDSNEMHTIYERYPMMKPFVGSNYGESENPSLLLIGESHYLPEGSKQHLKAKDWYEGDSSTLTEKEQTWINPTSSIAKSLPGGFKDKAKSIFRNSFQVINDYGPKFQDYRQVADHIVFYNYFLRPAKKGKSLLVKEEDVIIADEVFRVIYDHYQPDAIVFLSRLAYRKFRATEIVTVPLKATPHPGSAYWNRAASRYGGKRGRDLLSELIGELKWTCVSSL